MLPAHFKDWHSNLTNNIHVEKLLWKVIEFENLSTQIRINLDVQTDHNKTLARVKRKAQTWNKLLEK